MMGRLVVSLLVVAALAWAGLISKPLAVAVWILLWSLLDLLRDTRWEYILPYGAALALLLLHWLL